MASKLKVDQIEGQSGTSVEVPTGHTLKVADLGNNKILSTNSSGVVVATPMGSTDQVLKMTGTNTIGFGADQGGKILGTSFISYATRFTPPQSPSSGTGYANTINIFPTNTFQYTKTIQNSFLAGWLVVSGKGGGQTHHSRGVVSFSTDGSTIESKQNVGSGTTGSNDPNHSNFLFKVANNVSAGTITIDPRYGGNGNRWWDIVNPNGTDHAEYDNATNSHMFIMEVAN